MYKAIFWDNDGILVNTEELYFEASRDILRKVGIELSLDLYRQLFLKEARGAWHLVREKGYDDAEVAGMREERADLYASFLETREIMIDGAADVLRELSGKIRMGIVTSSRRTHFDIIHARTGLMPMFEFVVASGDYTNTKPDPEPYLVALKRTGLDPKDCLVIEDSERGLTAAKAAGLDCWVIPTDLTCDSDFSKADKRLDSISQVPGLLFPE